MSTGFSVAATKATSLINRTTQAALGAGTLNTSGGPVNVHAHSTSNSTLDGTALGVGVAAVTIVLLDSKVATTTQASIGDGANVSAGVVDVNAHADNTVVATSLNVGIKIAGGSGTDINATDDSNVNSFVGPVEGSGSGGATVNTTGNVTVASLLDSNTTADALTASLTLFADIGDITGHAKNTAHVRSYLGHGATITATGLVVSFAATSHSRTATDAEGLSGSLGFAGAGVFSHEITSRPRPLCPIHRRSRCHPARAAWGRSPPGRTSVRGCLFLEAAMGEGAVAPRSPR